jgi:hypothetical protein
MKLIKYISLFLAAVLILSCEENEIVYKAATSASDDLAEFQLHYVVPVNGVSTNYIYKVEINDVLYANNTAPLSTYSVIPDGAVGRFFTATQGDVNIKLYKGTDATLVYNQSIALTKGKQNIFVHDFNKQPIVFDNGYPYESISTTLTGDSICFVKFYNFLYESDGVPCPLKLQYQYLDSRTNVYVNMGIPVSFGETTGWQPVKIVKSVPISGGYNKITYKIVVINNDGSVAGDLQLLNSSNKYVSYSDNTKTEYIGRRYHHTLAGIRTASPVASVREFTAL